MDKKDQIQSACEQFKSSIEKLGNSNVVVVYGYVSKDEEIHSGYASDGTFTRIGFLQFLLLREQSNLLTDKGIDD